MKKITNWTSDHYDTALEEHIITM